MIGTCLLCAVEPAILGMDDSIPVCLLTYLRLQWVVDPLSRKVSRQNGYYIIEVPNVRDWGPFNKF